MLPYWWITNKMNKKSCIGKRDGWNSGERCWWHLVLFDWIECMELLIRSRDNYYKNATTAKRNYPAIITRLRFAAELRDVTRAVLCYTVGHNHRNPWVIRCNFRGNILHRVSIKRHPSISFSYDNSVKYEPILIIFGTHYRENIWD